MTKNCRGTDNPEKQLWVVTMPFFIKEEIVPWQQSAISLFLYPYSNGQWWWKVLGSLQGVHIERCTYYISIKVDFSKTQ